MVFSFMLLSTITFKTINEDTANCMGLTDERHQKFYLFMDEHVRDSVPIYFLRIVSLNKLKFKDPIVS